MLARDEGGQCERVMPTFRDQYEDGLQVVGAI
jgi:hypothetical protein